MDIENWKIQNNNSQKAFRYSSSDCNCLIYDYYHNGIGPYNHQDEFYAYQETSPEIVNYTHRYIVPHFLDVEYLAGVDLFIRFQVLFCVGFNKFSRYKKIYLDVTYLNELYEHYNAMIPQKKFDQIIFEKYDPYSKYNKLRRMNDV